MAHKFSVRTFYSVLVVAFALLPSYVSSQIVEKIFENPVLYERMYPLHDHSGAILDFPGKEVDSTLDVKSYELWFDLRRLVTVPHSERGQMHFSGIVHIVFTVTKPVDRITLDAEKISVLVASVNNQLTEVEKSAGGVTVTPFISEKGKILPRRITGVCAAHQRMLTEAVKQARNIALLPFAANA